MTAPPPAAMIPEERAKLRELCDNALPGPWETHYDEDMGEVSIQVSEEVDGMPGYIEVATTAQWPDDQESSPTAEFIRASRTAIPALLDALDATEARIIESTNNNTNRGEPS